MLRNFATPVLLAALLAIAGCSASPSLEGTVPASGTVTQADAPVDGATVIFAPVNASGPNANRAASGITDASGHFTLQTLKPGDGAMPGDYKVSITKKETVGKEYTTEEANAYYNEHKQPPPAPEVKHLLPEKYARPSSSGLTASVKAGDKNEFTFNLE